MYQGNYLPDYSVPRYLTIPTDTLRMLFSYLLRLPDTRFAHLGSKRLDPENLDGTATVACRLATSPVFHLTVVCAPFIPCRIMIE